MEDSFRQLKIVHGDFVIPGYIRSPDCFRLGAVARRCGSDHQLFPKPDIEPLGTHLPASRRELTLITACGSEGPD